MFEIFYWFKCLNFRSKLLLEANVAPTIEKQVLFM